jgi:predicted Co/Zn/Cd cation transporter (cation efflux family)
MSRRQKRVVFYSSPLIVLLVIVLLVKLKLDQIEANAQQLAQMGQTAQAPRRVSHRSGEV